MAQGDFGLIGAAPGGIGGPDEEAALERELELLMGGGGGGGGNARSKKRPAPKGGRAGADLDAMVADIMRYVAHPRMYLQLHLLEFQKSMYFPQEWGNF